MKRLFEKIRAMFTRIKPKFQATIEKAVMITEKLKEILTSPAFDAATALTPFQQDEKILAAVRNAIDYVSTALAVVGNPTLTTEERLLAISGTLQHYPPQFKKIFYREFAAAVAHALSDGKLSAWELFTLTQTAYRALKDKELDTSNIENESVEETYEHLPPNFPVNLMMTDSLKKMAEENPDVAKALNDLDGVFDKSVQELMEDAGKTITDGMQKDTSND